MKNNNIFEKKSVEATINLLSAIHEDDDHSQRNLATKIGVALGLTNALVKRCVKKGLLKIQDAPARRYAYYLTPKGFQEKSRLTAEYLSFSLDFFRHARAQYGEVISYCETRGWNRVAFYGVGELSEIAFLAVQGTDVKLAALIDAGKAGEHHCGLVVSSSLDDVTSAQPIDAFVVTTTAECQEAYEFLREKVGDERVLTPRVLNVSRIQDLERDG